MLGVDGAGLSVLDAAFRVPLGTSGELASVAERLQFTQGEGPCLDAARAQRVLVADAAQLDRRWPSYAAELFARTPFRGIVTMPLSLAASTKGAVDLFVTDERTLPAVTLADAITVADAVAEELSDTAQTSHSIDQWSGESIPSWLTGPSAQQRRYIWIAAGIVVTRFDTTFEDALALLRSYAYGHGTDLDDLARSLVEGDLPVERLEV